MRDRPDILFILSDQHARGIAGCYGDPVAQTPHLDRLADAGVTFDAAYCPAPICTPSRMSLLTGRWPHEQHCWTLEDQLASDIPTYAHALGAAGYRTILCGRMHAVGPDQLHGFSERDVGDCSPNWLGAPRQDLGPLAGAQGPAPPRDGDDRSAVGIRLSGRGQSGYQVVDDATTEAACARLEDLAAARAAGDDRPFLLSVGYLLPHCPFVARSADYDAFLGRVGLPRLPPPNPEHPWLAQWRRTSRTDVTDPQDVIRARTAYYGLVRSLDAGIGRVLDALDRAGFTRDTLIVYASDHGEQLGERGLWWKNTFYEESAGVPLILSWPARIPGAARSARVVNLVDIGATLIAAAGAPQLAGSHGRDLATIATDATAPWVDETFSEYVTDLSSDWTGPEATCQRMIRSGRWKFLHVAGYPPQLFDLRTDPDEMHDLGADPAHAGIRERLGARVLSGWDPDAIATEVARRARDKALLRAWGAATAPESRYRFEITAADSWLEADPARHS